MSFHLAMGWLCVICAANSGYMLYAGTSSSMERHIILMLWIVIACDNFADYFEKSRREKRDEAE
jgi:hypothetical protein